MYSPHVHVSNHMGVKDLTGYCFVFRLKMHWLDSGEDLRFQLVVDRQSLSSSV